MESHITQAAFVYLKIKNRNNIFKCLKNLFYFVENSFNKLHLIHSNCVFFLKIKNWI